MRWVIACRAEVPVGLIVEAGCEAAGGDSGKMDARLVRGLIIALILGTVALLVVFKISGVNVTWSDLMRIDPIVVAVALALVAATWVFDSLRMSALVRAMGENLGFWSGIRVAITGVFVASLMPFNAGGEPMQIYLLRNEGLSMGQASAVVAVKTFCNALAKVIVAFTASSWIVLSGIGWRVPSQMKVVLLTAYSLYVAFFLFALFLMADPRRIETVVAPILRSRIVARFLGDGGPERVLRSIRKWTAEFETSLAHYWERERWTLLAVIYLSVAGWLALILVPTMILAALGIGAPSEQVMANVILFHMISSYVPTPGASGAAELGFAELFRMVIPPALIGLTVALWRLLTYYFTLMVGGALTIGQLLRRAMEPTEE